VLNSIAIVLMTQPFVLALYQSPFKLRDREKKTKISVRGDLLSPLLGYKGEGAHEWRVSLGSAG